MSTTRWIIETAESVDVDAAWEVYYQLADRRHNAGLTIEELRQVIEAALVGVVEVKVQSRSVAGQNDDGSLNGEDYIEQRFVSPWVEVEKVT